MTKSICKQRSASLIGSTIVSLAAAGALLMPAGAMAAATITSAGTVQAGATVVTPMSIAGTSALNFGTFAGGLSTGTVILNSTTGARSATGGVTLVATSSGSSGGVTVAGAANAIYTVIVPTAGVTLSNGLGQTMQITAFETSLATGTIGGGGTSTFRIGGTLAVGVSQAVGSYVGSFPITVSYE